MRIHLKALLLTPKLGLYFLLPVLMVVLSACGTTRPTPTSDLPQTEEVKMFSSEWYGSSFDQLNLIGLPKLHKMGFTGKGVRIAHFDSGFDGLPIISAFDHCRSNNLGMGAMDFVGQDSMLFINEGQHGLETFGIVHAFSPKVYVGAAWNASYLLARTENDRKEGRIEEEYWRQAVDWAIANEVDIITSSLQYNEFDKGEGDYTYADMDGQTATITKAAKYAARKGILVVGLQGNFGDANWKYLTAPGDADSILTVGAVNVRGKIADFSGYGPSYDGRVKPDVVAVGEQTFFIRTNGRVGSGNGTSYACPLIAGLAACLMEAFPEANAQQVLKAIRQSADRYQNPDNRYGYGLPNAERAFQALKDGNL